MKKVIFRADDLGYSEGVNLGIAKTVKKGLVGTVGLIVNLKHSQEGFELIKEEELCLGLHVNISYGPPISEPSLLPTLLNENGRFKTSKEYNHALRDFISYEEAYRETEAQYGRFREITGRDPDYVEGHAVQRETYLKAVKAVADKYGLLYIPSLLSPEEFFMVKNERLHFWMESMKEEYDPLQTFLKMCAVEREGVEVMVCHPGFIDDQLLQCSSLLLPRVREVQFLIGNELKDLLRQQHIQVTTYKKLAERG